MKRSLKRIAAILTAVVLLLSSYSIVGISASAAVIGDDVDPSQYGDYTSSKELGKYLTRSEYSRILDGVDYALKLSNEAVVAKSVEVSITDPTGTKLLVGASLEIQDEEDNVIDSWKSDGSIHTINDIETGKYYLVCSNPANYYYKGTTVSFWVREGEVTKVVMKCEPTVCTISDLDENGEPLLGKQYSLEDFSGNVIDSWVTDGEVRVLEAKLIAGKMYKLKTVKQVDGYIKGMDILVDVKYNPSTTGIIVNNKPTVTQISHKALEGDDELVGAVLQLTDKDGEVIDTWTSERTAHEVKKLIYEDTYTITELSPAPGYVSAEAVSFDVVVENLTNMSNAITKVTTRSAPVSFEFSYVDDNGRLVSGSQMSVINNDGKVVDTWVADGKTNHTNVGELVVGQEYTLSVDEVSDRYTKPDDVKFTVKDTPDVQTVKVIGSHKESVTEPTEPVIEPTTEPTTEVAEVTEPATKAIEETTVATEDIGITEVATLDQPATSDSGYKGGFVQTGTQVPIIAFIILVSAFAVMFTLRRRDNN